MARVLDSPGYLVTTTAPGLMSATDKTKLDGMTPSSYYVKPANGIPASDIYFGSGLWYNNNGQLIVDPADAAQIKNEVTNIPIPAHQTAAATFYGLARAAGDSTQKASSNAVGVYTSGAKTAIQNMLGVAPTNNPVFTGSISLGRKANTTVGADSFAVGFAVEASEIGSHAEGDNTVSAGRYVHVEGLYNVIDNNFDNWPTWTSGTSYAVGDKVKRTVNYYNDDNEIIESTQTLICTTANNSWIFDPDEWSFYKYKDNYNYAHIVGNGLGANDRSNAYALDWYGNGYYKGDLYVGCNANSTGGSKVATETYVTSALANVSGGISGVKLLTTSLTPDSNGVVTIPAMTGATSSAAGAAGLVPAPATTDVDKFLAGDGTYKSGGLPMVILSYGSSTWAEFEAAYNNNVIVYCRASSNSNPASGSQTRMAFMAYVNNATTPTNVEFQYYRSVNTHSATQMGDQVFIYKLDKTSGWSVTTREASIKEINVASGSKLGVSWSSNKVTLSNTMTADDMPMSSSDNTTVGSVIETNSQAITTYDFGVHTISDLETAFASYASNMINGQFKNMIFTVSAASGIWVTSSYYGTLRRDSNGRYNLFAQPMAGAAPIITGNYMSGTWTWEELTLNSNIKNRTLSISDGSAIPDSSNFNSLVTVGSYYVESAANAQTMTNIPVQAAGTLYVKNSMLKNNTYKQQIYITYNVDGIYMRQTWNNGTNWTNWDELALNSNIGDLSVLYTNSKSNLVSAINEVYPKDYTAIFNANTDRNTESNRIDAMEYMKSNYFDYGYTKASVRYQSGYYHFYQFMGEYTGADSCILEICHNLTPVLIVWRRSSAGVYTKTTSL